MATLTEKFRKLVGGAPKPAPVVVDETPLDRYYRLCDERDRKHRKVEPLKAELAALNAQAMAAQTRANAKAQEISDSLGGADWLKLKKEISTLARSLGRIPARP